VDHNHIHHAPAAHYWKEIADTQVAFTRISMIGLLRLSSQPRVLSLTLSNTEAWAIYQDFMALPNIQLLAEPAGLDTHFLALSTQAPLPHRLWTDAYLAAFALSSGCRLVSFDADFARFRGLNFLHLKP
jgi:toxin-antitoxin system PIN domain toxin